MVPLVKFGNIQGSTFPGVQGHIFLDLAVGP